MNQCKECGREWSDDMKECPICGWSGLMNQCKECGREWSDDMKECPICGGQVR